MEQDEGGQPALTSNILMWAHERTCVHACLCACVHMCIRVCVYMRVCAHTRVCESEKETETVAEKLNQMDMTLVEDVQSKYIFKLLLQKRQQERGSSPPCQHADMFLLE